MGEFSDFHTLHQTFINRNSNKVLMSQMPASRNAKSLMKVMYHTNNVIASRLALIISYHNHIKLLMTVNVIVILITIQADRHIHACDLDQ